jgi:hypothetical protein
MEDMAISELSGQFTSWSLPAPQKTHFSNEEQDTSALRACSDSDYGLSRMEQCDAAVINTATVSKTFVRQLSLHLSAFSLAMPLARQVSPDQRGLAPSSLPQQSRCISGSHRVLILASPPAIAQSTERRTNYSSCCIPQSGLMGL